MPVGLVRPAVSSEQCWAEARYAFGEAHAEGWMNGPNWRFASQPPVSRLTTPEGRLELYDMLCEVAMRLHLDAR